MHDSIIQEKETPVSIKMALVENDPLGQKLFLKYLTIW